MNLKGTGSTSAMFAVVFIVFIFFALILTSGTDKQVSALEYQHHPIIVERVVDGDTLDVRDKGVSYRVRLYGIDAPETTQMFGHKCKEHLAKLIENKTITLQRVGSDKYNRIICVMYSDNDCVNERMVLDGYAWYYPQTRPVSNIIRFHEHVAKNEKRGIWVDDNPVPPWIYRKESK